MKNLTNRFISFIQVFVLALSLCVPAFAAEAPTAEETNLSISDINVHSRDYVLTEQEKNAIKEIENVGLDPDFLEKLLTVSNYIEFSKDQKSLVINLSDEILVREYDFTVQQLDVLKTVLSGTYQFSTPSVVAAADEERGIRVYLSYEDLTIGVAAALTAAAQAGPEAIMAAWTYITTATGGPLGSLAGIAVSLLGAAFFADVALKVVGAVAEHKGVAFYIDWGMPPVSVKIE